MGEDSQPSKLVQTEARVIFISSGIPTQPQCRIYASGLPPSDHLRGGAEIAKSGFGNQPRFPIRLLQPYKTRGFPIPSSSRV
jgi:hypothetical protein